MGEYRQRLARLGDIDKPVTDESPYIRRRRDLAAAVDRLKGRELLVMALILNGFERDEIAEQRQLSYKQVIYTIERAAPKLRRLLSAYREEDL